MSAVPAILPIEEPEQLHKTPTDVLGRQEFVNQMIQVANTISDSQQGVCYAINGDWGVGKTFVLEAFEKQISVYQQNKDGADTDKFIVFHYNCWEYDYYEEPLIALVAVILDQIDQKAKLIPPEKMERIKSGLKIIGYGLWRKAKELIEDKTGIPVDKIESFIKDVDSDAKKQIEDNHEFDTYYDFKQTLTRLSHIMVQLAEDQTLILVVDELDRCLPEYTVKVLERLHHVFEGVDNIQVILAVDKNQLQNTIKQIYGDSTSVDGYLEKFINFEMLLGPGESTNIIKKHYPDYYNSFTIIGNAKYEVEEVYNTLLKGIDVRKCRAIVQKCQLCHQMVFGNHAKKNGTFLCVELFLTILRVYGLDIGKAKAKFNISHLFSPMDLLHNGMDIFSNMKEMLPGLLDMSDVYTRKDDGLEYYAHPANDKPCVRVGNIWGTMLACYRLILGFYEDAWYEYPDNFGYNRRVEKEPLLSDVKAYWEFLNLIK